MFKYIGGLSILIALALGTAYMMSPSPAAAASATEIDRSVNSVLKKLYKAMPAAKTLSGHAKGILVFPSIVKAGFMVGGQYGEGALQKGSKTVAYYNTVSFSYGLQIGAQEYGYALFFMTDSALKYLDRSDGWEVGVGPSVVVVDEGMAKSMTTTTARDEIYAFIFQQKGLMAGMGLQGTKITKIEK